MGSGRGKKSCAQKDNCVSSGRQAIEQQQAFFAKVFLGAALFATISIGGGFLFFFAMYLKGLQ
jgi:hypothetical protein